MSYIMSQLWRLALLGAFLALFLAMPLLANAATEVNGDFSLQVMVNGDDILEMETIIIHPDRELTIDLYISGVTREVSLQKVSAAITFAGRAVITLSHDLGGFRVGAGGEYADTITIRPREALKLGNLTLVTGIYQARVRLDYTVAGRAKTWGEAKNIKVPGNPLRTPVGVAAAMVSAGAAAAILFLVRSLSGAGLVAGTTLPGATPLTPSRALHELGLERLEPAARGRVVGSMVKGAKGLAVKESCPICGTRIRRGHCYTCRKSVKELRREYAERVSALAFQGAELLAGGGVATLDALCSKLGTDARLGSDVVAVLKNARLVKVTGVARKVMGKAVMAGIGSGLSAVLWITVGGLAVLSATALVVILVASIVVPLAAARGLQMKARRALKKQV
jgi:hypothetical protein